MQQRKLFVVVFIQIFITISNQSKMSLEINRARSHYDQTGDLTPLVVSLFSEDKIEKVTGVDLICIIDTSGSMYGSPISLARESLKYLVNLMTEEDNFALVEFNSYARLINGFTKMSSDNKESILNKINQLYASGGTNIYSGLVTALNLLNRNYTSEKRVASMILLSDGEDSHSVIQNFQNYISTGNKNDYAFTLHTFGYGDYHDAELMYKLSLIRDGGYFYISKLIAVQDAFVKIYGSLSTVCNINLQLKLESNFPIQKVYGMEDMYEANLTNTTIDNSFRVKIIQAIYGKSYYYVLLLNVPNNTKIGTEVLKATVSPLGISATYYWNEKYSSYAYEEYIRCIIFTYILNAYYAYDSYYSDEKVIMNEGLEWIRKNYKGQRDWENEFIIIINSFDSSYSYYNTNADILSRLRELKTLQIGSNYNYNENSYINNIIYVSHNIDISRYPKNIVRGELIISFISTINYYYFYLKEGVGEINNLFFFGEGSSIMIFSDGKTGNINITSLTDYVEYHYSNETKIRTQSINEFYHPGKFIIMKDSPIEFYSRVDGTRDITFNIQFFKLQINKISEPYEDLFEIIAYIIDDDILNNINSNKDYIPKTQIYSGSYNTILKIGELTIKKEVINTYLSSTMHNYIYIIVKKISTNIIYNYIEGQMLFFSHDYIYSPIPQDFYIYNKLSKGQNIPHLYTITMEKLYGKYVIIEFTSGNELDCKILKYQNYPAGSQEIFLDFDEYKITRRQQKNITYIYIYQSIYIDSIFEYIIVSIFSKNDGHIAGNNESELIYTMKYNTYSKLNGLYNVSNNESNLTDIEEDKGNLTDIEEDITPPPLPPPTQPPVIIRKRAEVIFLGFARYIYVRITRICNFYMYFASIREIISVKIVRVYAYIRYRGRLRALEEEKKQVECGEVVNEFNNSLLFNCSFETNGEEIENLRIDKNFEFDGEEEVEIVGISPLAKKYMENIQDVGDTDKFNKTLFILDNSTIKTDNDNHIFNITGVIDDKDFNYKNLELTAGFISSDNQYIEKNIPCDVINMNENYYTLKCNTKDSINGTLDGAFSDLGNENLIVNLVDNSNQINFTESNNFNLNRIYNSKSSGLSAGGIVGIIIACLAVVAISISIILCLKRKPNINQDTSTIVNINSSKM